MRREHGGTERSGKVLCTRACGCFPPLDLAHALTYSLPLSPSSLLTVLYLHPAHLLACYTLPTHSTDFSQRGTAIGIVVAGYGLSAFVYATISGYISGDDTAAFLLILAVGTFSSLLGSSIFLTPQRMQAAFSPTSHPSPSPFSSPTTTTALQAAEYRSLGEAREHVETAETILDEDGNDVVGDIEENKAYGAASSHGPPRRRSVGKDDDIGGVGLFKSLDYWMMMLVTFCLTGTGECLTSDHRSE